MRTDSRVVAHVKHARREGGVAAAPCLQGGARAAHGVDLRDVGDG
jgi:hypothetical protein